MKFLVDANLPFKLAISLRKLGLDVIHTDNLPIKEKTSDKEIRAILIYENRIVVSKDTDFLDSHLINGVPEKFLYISTGNIINRDLLILIEKNIAQIMLLFDSYNLIELTNDELIVHEN